MKRLESWEIKKNKVITRQDLRRRDFWTITQLNTFTEKYLYFQGKFYIPDFWIAAMVTIKYRSSRPEVFCKKIVLKNLAKFTAKHLCQWVPVNLANLLRTLFFHRTPTVAAFENIRRNLISRNLINRSSCSRVFKKHFWKFCRFPRNTYRGT